MFFHVYSHLLAKGTGKVALLIGIVCPIVVYVASGWVVTDYNLYVPKEFNEAMIGVSFLLSGFICGRTEIGDEVLHKESHLLFIPVKYWPHIYTAVGLLITLDTTLTYFRLI